MTVSSARHNQFCDGLKSYRFFKSYRSTHSFLMAATLLLSLPDDAIARVLQLLPFSHLLPTMSALRLSSTLLAQGCLGHNSPVWSALLPRTGAASCTGPSPSRRSARLAELSRMDVFKRAWQHVVGRAEALQ